MDCKEHAWTTNALQQTENALFFLLLVGSIHLPLTNSYISPNITLHCIMTAVDMYSEVVVGV